MPFCRILPPGLLCLLVVLVCASQSEARPEMAAGLAQERFTAMDADKDRHISRKEFFAAQPDMKDSAFEAIDTDRDGLISVEEWAQFTAGHGRGTQVSMPPHGGNATAHGDEAARPAPAQEDQAAPRVPALIPPAPKGD